MDLPGGRAVGPAPTSAKKKRVIQKDIIIRAIDIEESYMRVEYSFLPADQIRGKVLNRLGIPSRTGGIIDWAKIGPSFQVSLHRPEQARRVPPPDPNRKFFKTRLPLAPPSLPENIARMARRQARVYQKYGMPVVEDVSRRSRSKSPHHRRRSLSGVRKSADGKHTGDASRTPGTAKKTPGAANKTPGAANKTPGAADRTPWAASQPAGSATTASGAANRTPRAASQIPEVARKTPRAALKTPGAASQTPRPAAPRTPRAALEAPRPAPAPAAPARLKRKLFRPASNEDEALAKESVSLTPKQLVTAYPPVYDDVFEPSVSPEDINKPRSVPVTIGILGKSPGKVDRSAMAAKAKELTRQLVDRHAAAPKAAPPPRTPRAPRPSRARTTSPPPAAAAPSAGRVQLSVLGGRDAESAALPTEDVVSFTVQWKSPSPGSPSRPASAGPPTPQGPEDVAGLKRKVTKQAGVAAPSTPKRRKSSPPEDNSSSASLFSSSPTSTEASMRSPPPPPPPALQKPDSPASVVSSTATTIVYHMSQQPSRLKSPPPQPASPSCSTIGAASTIVVPQSPPREDDDDSDDSTFSALTQLAPAAAVPAVPAAPAAAQQDGTSSSSPIYASQRRPAGWPGRRSEPRTDSDEEVEQVEAAAGVVVAASGPTTAAQSPSKKQPPGSPVESPILCSGAVRSSSRSTASANSFAALSRELVRRRMFEGSPDSERSAAVSSRTTTTAALEGSLRSGSLASDLLDALDDDDLDDHEEDDDDKDDDDQDDDDQGRSAPRSQFIARQGSTTSGRSDKTSVGTLSPLHLTQRKRRARISSDEDDAVVRVQQQMQQMHVSLRDAAEQVQRSRADKSRSSSSRSRSNTSAYRLSREASLQASRAGSSDSDPEKVVRLRREARLERRRRSSSRASSAERLVIVERSAERFGGPGKVPTPPEAKRDTSSGEVRVRRKSTVVEPLTITRLAQGPPLKVTTPPMPTSDYSSDPTPASRQISRPSKDSVDAQPHPSQQRPSRPLDGVNSQPTQQRLSQPLKIDKHDHASVSTEQRADVSRNSAVREPRMGAFRKMSRVCEEFFLGNAASSSVATSAATLAASLAAGSTERRPRNGSEERSKRGPEKFVRPPTPAPSVSGEFLDLSDLELSDAQSISDFGSMGENNDISPDDMRTRSTPRPTPRTPRAPLRETEHSDVDAEVFKLPHETPRLRRTDLAAPRKLSLCVSPVPVRRSKSRSTTPGRRTDTPPPKQRSDQHAPSRVRASVPLDVISYKQQRTSSEGSSNDVSVARITAALNASTLSEPMASTSSTMLSSVKYGDRTLAPTTGKPGAFRQPDLPQNVLDTTTTSSTTSSVRRPSVSQTVFRSQHPTRAVSPREEDLACDNNSNHSNHSSGVIDSFFYD